MARQIRIEYAGATYHVMARGNHGQAIFADEQDRRLWLETLGEVCEKTGWRVHAFVIMGNHYHLLSETPEANLVAGMKWFQGVYTQRYNSRHQVSGHLFQGRYKALVVDGKKGDYLGAVSTYIHLNPARAKRIRIGEQPLASYRWSSYPWYVKLRHPKPGWLETQRVMGNLGFKPRETAGYEAYMEGRALELTDKGGRRRLEAQWKRIRRGWYLGGDGFRGQILKRVKEALSKGQSDSYQGNAKRVHGEAHAEQLLRAGMAALGVRAKHLEQSPKGSVEKKVLAYWLRQRTTVKRWWLCERLHMGEVSAVTRAMRMVKSTRDPRVKQMKKRLGELSEEFRCP